MNRRQETGRLGEIAARRRLEALGYAIRGVNVRAGQGEIDIVADESGDIVFVEVRTRRSRRLGTPEESITPSKRERLLTAAQRYLQSTDAENRNWRIDIVAVELDRNDGIARLSVLKNAVEA